jgi:HSP20 family protein
MPQQEFARRQEPKRRPEYRPCMSAAAGRRCGVQGKQDAARKTCLRADPGRASSGNPGDSCTSPQAMPGDRESIMANITRFDPFGDLARMDPFPNMNDFFRGFALRPVFRDAEAEPQIKLDVSEDKDMYTIKAEVPGVKKEDIQVSIDGNRVSITAELKKEKEEKEGKNVIRSERYYGRATRTFTLDQEVDQGGAKARYLDGVLELALPKKAGSTAKRLDIL